MDVTGAEAQLNAMIEKRAREREAAGAIEDLWAASVRRDKERRRRALQAEWHAFYSRLAESHARMSERFAGRAEEMLEDDERSTR